MYRNEWQIDYWCCCLLDTPSNNINHSKRLLFKCLYSSRLQYLSLLNAKSYSLFIAVGYFPSLACIIIGQLVLILENLEELPGEFNQQRQEFLSMIQMIIYIICRSLLEEIVLTFGHEEASSWKWKSAVDYVMCYSLLWDLLDEWVTNVYCNDNIHTPLLWHPAHSHKYVSHIQLAYNGIMIKKQYQPWHLLVFLLLWDLLTVYLTFW